MDNSFNDISYDYWSSYYRVCPNCGIGHMAANRGRSYCTDQCADAHYNRIKRKFNTPGSIIRASDGVTIGNDSVQPQPPGNKYRHQDLTQKQLITNISLLNLLKIDPKKGATYNINELNEAGFVFTAYSDKSKIRDTSDGVDCYAISYGNYEFFFTQKGQVLICKK